MRPWRTTQADMVAATQCVFDVDRVAGKLTLTELAEGVSLDEVKAKTGAAFDVSPNLITMQG